MAVHAVQHAATAHQQAPQAKPQQVHTPPPAAKAAPAPTADRGGKVNVVA